MMRVLLVDDEAIIRESIAAMIPWEELGYQLIGTAENGIVAYDMIRDEYPDVILTDICMPVMTGLELIEKANKLDETIKYVVLSGYNEFDYAKQAMKFGVKHYLLKPTDKRQIIDALREVKKTALQEKVIRDKETHIEKIVLRIQDCESEYELNKIIFPIFEAIEKIEIAKSMGIDILLKSTTKSSVYETDRVEFFESMLDTKLTVEQMGKNLVRCLCKCKNLYYQHEFKENSHVEKLKKYVEQHLNDENLSLKWLAENYLFVSVGYLSKQFVKEEGERFSDYLNRNRMERAKQMLQREGINVQTAAEACGFGNNPRYFAQVFKRYTGITPTEHGLQMCSKNQSIIL